MRICENQHSEELSNRLLLGTYYLGMRTSLSQNAVTGRGDTCSCLRCSHTGSYEHIREDHFPDLETANQLQQTNSLMSSVRNIAMRIR